jgi:hypothetical protein
MMVVAVNKEGSRNSNHKDVEDIGRHHSEIAGLLQVVCYHIDQRLDFLSVAVSK